VEQLEVIDTESLKVVQRMPIPASLTGYIDPTTPRLVFPMASGKLLIGLNTPYTEPFSLAERDPATGALAMLPPPPGFGFSFEASLAGSANGKYLLAVDYPTFSKFAVFDSASDEFTASGSSKGMSGLTNFSSPAQRVQREN
jgi:hypothetical protein